MSLITLNENKPRRPYVYYTLNRLRSLYFKFWTREKKDTFFSCSSCNHVYYPILYYPPRPRNRTYFVCADVHKYHLFSGGLTHHVIFKCVVQCSEILHFDMILRITNKKKRFYRNMLNDGSMMDDILINRSIDFC